MSGIRELTPSRARPQARVEERLAEFERQLRDVKGYRTSANPFAQQGWQTIGATGAAPFASGWSAAASPLSQPAYFLDPSGILHLKGAFVRTGVITTAAPAEYPANYSSTMFTLPTGYRPTERNTFFVLQANTSAGGVANQGNIVFIAPSGDVNAVVADNTATSWRIYLDGYTLRVY